MGTLVSELELLSEEEHLPAKVRSEGETEAQGRELSTCPAASAGEEVPLPSLLLGLAPSSRREEASGSCPPEPGRLPKSMENLHLNVSALGHCRGSRHSSRRKEDPLNPERAQSAWSSRAA